VQDGPGYGENSTCNAVGNPYTRNREGVRVLSTTDKMLFLKRVSIFSSMTLEQVRVLTSHLDEQHFLPGEIIFKEGDFSPELYILVAGRVQIIKDYRGPHARLIAVFEPGDFFGEMAIFEGAPRSGTARTIEETELLVLSPDKFKQTIYQKPDMAFEIFRELSSRLRRREEEENV
jgi:CRP/FNR family transcriptional regulator, cyclic AMP receptor protein